MKNQGLKKINFNFVKDTRGFLSSIEGDSCIPFKIKRVFYIHQVPKNISRGGHAHRYTNQVLIALSGQVKVICSSGRDSHFIELNNPNQGLLIPQMTWTDLSKFSEGSICLVLADTHYNISHSIRDWDSFLKEKKLEKLTEPQSKEANYKNLDSISEFNDG